MFWKILIVLLISMVPLIELRGAIPVAVGMDLGLPEWLVLIVAIIGNILPVPIIYFFAQKVLIWGSKCNGKRLRNSATFVLRKERKAAKNSSKKPVSMAPTLHSFSSSLYRFPVPAPGPEPWPPVS